MTNYPKIPQFKTITFLSYLTVSIGQESQSSIARWCLFRFSHNVTVKLLSVAIVISRLDTGWAFTSRLVWLLAGLSSSLTIDQRPSFFAMWAAHILPVFHHEMTTGFPQSEWAKEEWAQVNKRAPKIKTIVFYNLNCKVTFHHSCLMNI